MQPARLLRPARGQALVLFALTLLLLTLMVLMTLGFGMRAKERLEIQMASDAAAYSQAVAVARTFNAIAVLNRAQVAHMVAMAGTQSLISYGSQQYAANRMSPCPTMPDVVWSGLDQAAATQVRQLQGRAGAMYSAEIQIYGALVNKYLSKQQLAQAMARQVNPELVAPEGGAVKSLAEVSGGGAALSQKEIGDQQVAGIPFDTSGAVQVAGGGHSRETLHATMGSLGWTWVHNRGSGSASFGSGVAAHNTDFTHYGSSSQMDSATYETVSGLNSSAHDHGRAVVIICPNGTVVPMGATDSWVMSDHEQSKEDQHVYGARGPPGQGSENGKAVDERHTLGPCRICPGIWPGSIGFNTGLLQGNAALNDYGQPKVYSVLSRDYASPTRQARPDPWNLFFNFRFAGSREQFDNASPEGRIASAPVGDVQRSQVALSAGITYYHRPEGQGGGWREPPNFLNPFWRASLVSAEGSIDDKPAASLGAAGFSEHANALRRLDRAGFRGGSPHGAGY